MFCTKSVCRGRKIKLRGMVNLKFKCKRSVLIMTLGKFKVMSVAMFNFRIFTIDNGVNSRLQRDNVVMISSSSLSLLIEERYY